MVETIEKAHTASHQQQYLGAGEQNVDPPEQLGGVLDAWFQTVSGRAGDFGLKELHAADPEHWQDGERKYDNSHAAEPLRQ